MSSRVDGFSALPVRFLVAHIDVYQGSIRALAAIVVRCMVLEWPWMPLGEEMKKNKHFALISCAIYMSSMTVSAAETPADATSEAVTGSHQEEGTPEVLLFAVEGGALEVVVDCTACLLDVEVVRWREANGQRQEYVDADVDVVNDVVDGARIDLPQDLAGRALALEMRATLVSEDGTSLSEVDRVMFVAMTDEPDGLTTTPISWADYLLANRLARVNVRSTGTRVLDLSGVTP